MMKTPESPRDRFVCLHEGLDGGDWFAEQVLNLDATVIDAGIPFRLEDPQSVESWVAGVAAQLSRFHTPVHVIATGAAASGALALQVRNPELVRSLLLGDPVAPDDSPEFRAMLGAVTAPTLVIASAPDDTDNAISAAGQQIAGLVDNGVFVVIDGCRVPAHRERGSSFDEWVLSFAGIAEGIAAMNAAMNSAHEEKAHV